MLVAWCLTTCLVLTAAQPQPRLPPGARAAAARAAANQAGIQPVTNPVFNPVPTTVIPAALPGGLQQPIAVPAVPQPQQQQQPPVVPQSPPAEPPPAASPPTPPPPSPMPPPPPPPESPPPPPPMAPPPPPPLPPSPPPPEAPALPPPSPPPPAFPPPPPPQAPPPAPIQPPPAPISDPPAPAVAPPAAAPAPAPAPVPSAHVAKWPAPARAPTAEDGAMSRVSAELTLDAGQGVGSAQQEQIKAAVASVLGGDVKASDITVKPVPSSESSTRAPAVTGRRLRQQLPPQLPRGQPFAAPVNPNPALSQPQQPAPAGGEQSGQSGDSSSMSKIDIQVRTSKADAADVSQRLKAAADSGDLQKALGAEGLQVRGLTLSQPRTTTLRGSTLVASAPALAPAALAVAQPPAQAPLPAPAPAPQGPQGGSGGLPTWVIAVLVVAAALIMILIAGLGTYCIRKCLKKRKFKRKTADYIRNYPPQPYVSADDALTKRFQASTAAAPARTLEGASQGAAKERRPTPPRGRLTSPAKPYNGVGASGAGDTTMNPLAGKQMINITGEPRLTHASPYQPSKKALPVTP